MDKDKIREEWGYKGKPLQWRAGFDAALSDIESYLKKKTAPMSGPFSVGLDGRTRYKLEYDGHIVVFSAAKSETREQLAEVLEKFIEILRAPEDTGELGFF